MHASGWMLHCQAHGALLRLLDSPSLSLSPSVCDVCVTSTKWNRPNLPISISVSYAASLVTVTLTYDMSSERNRGTLTLNGHTILPH